MYLKRMIVFLLLLLLAGNYCFSQEKAATISGTITEARTGEVVISASVMLFKFGAEISSSPDRGAYSNRFGFYSLPRVESGKYIFEVRSVGYGIYRQEIELRDSENLRLDIKLEQVDVKVGEITVEGERDVSPTRQISAIDVRPEFIAKMPSIGGEIDVFRTLQLLPGVQQANELSSGLYVRGGSPDQNLVLLDGVIVYNPSHLGGFLSTFNSEALRDIRLIKGAFPAEYGGRLSSVLDLTMKEGTKEKISGAGGISMISSRLTLEGPINENATFMVSGRRVYFDLLMKLLADDDDIPVYYFYDLNAKVNYKINESNRIFLSGYFGRDVLEAPPAERDYFGINWGNTTANLRWMHIVSPMLFTNFSFIYTHYVFETEFVDKRYKQNNFATNSLVEDFMLRGEAQYFPHPDHSIKTGLELTRHNFKAGALSQFFDEFDLKPSKSYFSLDAAFYIQDEWKINQKLHTNIGTRFYYFESGNYFNIEPRISMTYKLWDNYTLKGAFALANQFLHLIARNDMAMPTDLWFPSTKTIKPSRSLQGVLGLERLFAEGAYLVSLELYYKTMSNIYEYRDDAEFSFGIPIENQFTSGKGEAYGMEIFINKRIGSFTGWIGYTLAWTNRTFALLNEGKPFSPRYDRRHDVSVTFNYDLNENWELGASWVYGTGQAFTMPTGIYRFDGVGTGWQNDEGTSNIWYDDASYLYSQRNGYRLPAFHKLDLNFMYKFKFLGMDSNLSINIYNAYNRRNPFAWYISRNWNDFDGSEGDRVIKQITLFPIIPTLGFNFKF